MKTREFVDIVNSLVTNAELMAGRRIHELALHVRATATDEDYRLLYTETAEIMHDMAKICSAANELIGNFEEFALTAS